jgi:hypothetical protein
MRFVQLTELESLFYRNASRTLFNAASFAFSKLNLKRGLFLETSLGDPAQLRPERVAGLSPGYLHALAGHGANVLPLSKSCQN